jgi:hypothetical protein
MDGLTLFDSIVQDEGGSVGVINPLRILNVEDRIDE